MGLRELAVHLILARKPADRDHTWQPAEATTVGQHEPMYNMDAPGKAPSTNNAASPRPPDTIASDTRVPHESIEARSIGKQRPGTRATQDRKIGPRASTWVAFELDRERAIQTVGICWPHKTGIYIGGMEYPTIPRKRKVIQTEPDLVPCGLLRTDQTNSRWMQLAGRTRGLTEWLPITDLP